MSHGASQSPVTRQSLLVRMRDTEDSSAWHEFVQIYAPLIHAYSRRRGLQDADAADIAQQVLQSVAQAMPGFEYDRGKGSFRGWLFTITRNHLIKVIKKQQRQAAGTGDTNLHQMLAQQPAGDSEEELWNEEHERRLFAWAAEKARVEFQEKTWQAFSLVAVEGAKAADAARRLKMSVGAVYIAKSRVTARIRELVQSVEPD